MKDITELKHRDQLGLWLNEAGLLGVGVEVGTFYGEYMEQIMRHWKGKQLICIDPWEKQDPSVYREPINNADWYEVFHSAQFRAAKFGGRVELMLGYSPQAAMAFEDGALSFVYLDGRHDLDAVNADLRVWWSKIQSGGLFGGHDFRVEHGDSQNCDVQTAVIQFAIDHQLKIHQTNGPGDQGWWIVKPE